jgi:hypothetical protein
VSVGGPVWRCRLWRCGFEPHADTPVPGTGLATTRFVKLTTVREGKITEQVRDCMGSHPLKVKTFARTIRGPSRMENNCHRVLDVTCRKEESRTREKCALGNIACPTGSRSHA